MNVSLSQCVFLIFFIYTPFRKCFYFNNGLIKGSCITFAKLTYLKFHKVKISYTALYKVYQVSPDAPTHKTEWFFQGSLATKKLPILTIWHVHCKYNVVFFYKHNVTGEVSWNCSNSCWMLADKTQKMQFCPKTDILQKTDFMFHGTNDSEFTVAVWWSFSKTQQLFKSQIWGLLVEWWVETVCVCNNGRLNILSASWRRSLGIRVDTGSEHGRGIMSRENICALLLKLGQSGSWSCWASGAESRCSVCPRWTRMGGWTQASSAEAPMTLGDSFQWKLENKHKHTHAPWFTWLHSYWKCYTSYSTFF